jgi:hypothetical protein
MIFSVTYSFQNFDVYVLVQIKGELTSACKVQPLKTSRQNDKKKTVSVLATRQTRFLILHTNWVLMLLMTNCEVGN